MRTAYFIARMTEFMKWSAGQKGTIMNYPESAIV